MRGNLAVPGGPLTSKPAWPNTSLRCSATPAFLSPKNVGSTAGQEVVDGVSHSADH